MPRKTEVRSFGKWCTNARRRFNLRAAGGWVAESARVARSARVFSDAYIGNGAVVHPAIIDSKTIVGPRSSIQADVFVGKKTMVATAVKIGRGTKIGSNVRIGPRVEIGNYVVIGNNVCIGRDSIVRSHCVLGSRAMVGRQVTLDYGLDIASFTFVARDTTWLQAPPTLDLRDDRVSVSRRGRIRSLYIDVDIASCTEEKLIESYKPGVDAGDIDKDRIPGMIRAIMFLVEGCRSNILYQGETTNELAEDL